MKTNALVTPIRREIEKAEAKRKAMLDDVKALDDQIAKMNSVLNSVTNLFPGRGRKPGKQAAAKPAKRTRRTSGSRGRPAAGSTADVSAVRDQFRAAIRKAGATGAKSSVLRQMVESSSGTAVSSKAAHAALSGLLKEGKVARNGYRYVAAGARTAAPGSGAPAAAPARKPAAKKPAAAKPAATKPAATKPAAAKPAAAKKPAAKKASGRKAGKVSRAGKAARDQLYAAVQRAGSKGAKKSVLIGMVREHSGKAVRAGTAGTALAALLKEGKVSRKGYHYVAAPSSGTGT